MKWILLGLSFFLAGNAVADNSCEQRLVAEIPDFLQQYQLSLSVGRQVYPISSDQPAVCVSRKDLAIFPRAFSNARVALVLSDGEQQAQHLLYSYSHLQAPEVRVGFHSTVISALCNTLCDYQEYLYLQQHSEVRQIAADLEQQFADLIAADPSAVFDRKKINALDFSSLSNTTILTEAFPEPLPPYKNKALETQYSFIPGSLRSYFSPLKATSFTNEIKSSLQRELAALLDEDASLEKPFAAVKQRFLPVYLADLPWPEYKAQFEIYVNKTASAEPELEPLWLRLTTLLQQYDARYQSRMLSQGQPYSYLTDISMPAETILAHWIRYADQHAPFIDDFAELFSARFKSSQLDVLLQNHQLTHNLGQLILVYARLATPNQGWDGSARVQFNYRGQFERNGNRLQLANALEQISFVFENGAWRLDHVCRMEPRTYQLCPEGIL